MRDDLGERLPGGNVTGAWRVGGTVRRSTGPWTPAVHALLRHLVGRLEHVPEVEGLDGRGREVLTYLPGRIVDEDTELLTDAQLWSLTRWTREMHCAVSDFRSGGPWRFYPVDHWTMIGHNDLGPYNVCFDGDDLVGVFDWDLAGPSTPLMELAFLAWNSVPLRRAIGVREQAARLTLVAQAYGDVSAAQILDAVPDRVRLVLRGIPAAAAAGDPGMQNLLAFGEPQRSRRALEGLLARIDAIRGHL
ncbi:phosphotransferase [Leekyejoonella antrihumi]|uniref:Aminoglycoside phosphotransferase family protein n=1 Tax=Leekyejoonella antrihumi TaxID=1660198 RepID=A0A563E382_9MICO|nr:phosphotransferase [Leekyejoonella antrihumi]TWP36988.1 aminoglycoside phosphotransferase family protein [Leekyejoonella antrihumi]